MTTLDRAEMEKQIQNDFSQLQKKLENLKNEVQSVTDDAEKEKKNEEIQKLEKEAEEIKALIDKFQSLKEEEVLALKTRLEEYRAYKQEILNVRQATPTTYELLKDSETCSRLLNIISSNPKEFANLPWDTAEKKLEYIFTKIRSSVVLFMKNKLWDSTNTEYVINNTIAPAFERNLMELLRDQWNEANVSMLKWMDKISFDSFNKLVKWVSNFANKTAGSYNKFSQWLNAVDYLSVHNWVLRTPNKSEVLTNPVKFQEYLNDPRFAAKDFSPYSAISDNIFKVDENQNFNFNLSDDQKQEVLQKIWNIQVVNNPRTTALIAWMLDKPEQFLQKTQWLQKTANGLLDWVDSINSVTKVFWVDILWDISKPASERWFLYKILDFVCKLIWITWGLEWIVKKWRLDRMNLTDEKNENISQIFKKFKEASWENISLSITWPESCKSALNPFSVTDPKDQSSTLWDHLRDSIADNVDINLVSPSVVQEILWAWYLKKEIATSPDGKQQEKVSIDVEKISDVQKKELAHKHLQIMKTYLESDYEALKDFYSNIHSSQDLALCITASLYANRDDVIDWVKAKVFLPENYGVVRMDGTVVESWNSWSWSLDSTESSDKQQVSEKWIYDKAKEYWITDNRQIAYVLSTIKWESWFKNQKEIWWENKSYWKVDATTWKAYYGRWFIQLTHKGNYEKYTQIIRDSWKDFKDNNGNIIKWSEIDLVKNPDIIIQSNDLAAFIAMDWMKNWGPSRQDTKKLDYYINDNKQDYYNARIIINWMTSKPQEYANNAQLYLNKLWNGSVDHAKESNEFLIGPKLLANNKDEIGWLGNSIMNWFQWLNAKTNFPNMDWVVWKNTRNHPHRFTSKDDVQSYKNSHPNIKSFMLYFWANNNQNQQTISDLEQWSDWLKELDIQPVLCTNIWADVKKTSHLWDLNTKILEIWREKNIPVVDFAKLYDGWKGIPLQSDWLHPQSYEKMSSTINVLLSA